MKLYDEGNRIAEECQAILSSYRDLAEERLKSCEQAEEISDTDDDDLEYADEYEEDDDE